MKLSAIFSVAEWTKLNLLGFVFNVYIKLISFTVIFTCATDDFKKSRKNVIFENCIKNCCLKKIKCLLFFKVARPVCSRLHFDFRKHFTQKPFIFENVFFFAFLQKKKRGSKSFFFSKTPPNCCPHKCRNLGKQSVQYHQRIVRKMRLKTFVYNFV